MIVTLYMVNITNKKILFIITKSNLGGAQKYVSKLASEVKRRGGIPVVAMGGTGDKNASVGPLAEQLNTRGIKTRSIKSFMRDMSATQDIKAFFELLQIIRAERPDVLHVTSSKAGGLGAFAGRICRVKTIIFTSHGLAFDETWRSRHQRFAIKLLTWCTLILSHKSIMISRDTYAKTSTFPFLDGKVVLIHNGVESTLSVSKKEARQILSPEMNTPRAIWIGGVGELHQNKNWLSVVDVMPSLPKQVRCIIIGEGEQMALLEKRILELGLQDRVLLKGYVQNASSLLEAYDVFILPSYKEGLPYVLLEAGLAKRAVACSNISGNTDIIHSGQNGLLFEHTKESLLSALTQLIESTPQRKEFGSALYQTVTTTFSTENMVEQTLNLYR